jgi:hypothetical protein
LAADVDEPVDRRAAEHAAAQIGMARPLVPGSASALKPQVRCLWSSSFM